MNYRGLFNTIVLLLFTFVIFILKQGGNFKNIKPHFEGNQEVQKTAPGIEDITTDLETGIAYLSSHDRRNPESEGTIFIRKPGRNSDVTEMVIPNIDIPLRPHGIALLKHKDYSYLFIVNHEKLDSSSIIRFQIKGDTLSNYTRFTHDLFISPNDIEAVSLDEFYITNDHTTTKGLWRTLKDFTLSKDGNVVFYKSGEASVVSQSISYPNGIRVSQNKEFLFVAATTENKLYVYQHHNEFKKRVMLDQKELSTSPDNIEIDKFGYLWIACHPKLLKFLAHKKDAATKSPSQFLKIEYIPNSDYKFLQEEVFLSSGEDLSGSSVASYFHTDSLNTMLVGSVFEEKILVLERDL